jgi:5-formyltetrahydrofolate cyclo-ligase
MDKGKIRNEVLKRRNSITAEDKKAKDEFIKNTLVGLAEFEKARAILLYASYKSEADTFGLIKHCFSMAKTVALPKVDALSSELKIYEIKDLRELVSGYQKIPEPDVPEERLLGVNDIDLIIVPGVAFDVQCNRLGYGKGFYDKMLNEKSCPAIALSYEEQIVGSVPAESHDIKMDIIITDKRIITRDGYQ